MLKIKKESKESTSVYNLAEISRKTGLTYKTVFDVVKNETECRKATAYLITKAFDSEAEIIDYFDVV